MIATNWAADPAAMLRKTVEHDAFVRAARRRDELVAEIQRRRDWGAWTETDLPADIIDLTERFAPKCEPEPPKLDREPESAFERQIAALLADKPSQAREYAFWACFLGLWAFIILALCMILSQ